eukprot:CAMPEP_0174731178 /NCGR_PEP_ID=MMETSP1094-20130205/57045_1 /TAXON_ID=156173 /ORGANISM="Chrysochromulina brevifilum, Strain UTEX LB 985" /LENGTH=185 /DNA_ID=CAMNT_0015933527 /DNA_START=79 /DNA_END=633 /DNA_ORIENTATION=+
MAPRAVFGTASYHAARLDLDLRVREALLLAFGDLTGVDLCAGGLGAGEGTPLRARWRERRWRCLASAIACSSSVISRERSCLLGEVAEGAMRLGEAEVDATSGLIGHHREGLLRVGLPSRLPPKLRSGRPGPSDRTGIRYSSPHSSQSRALRSCRRIASSAASTSVSASASVVASTSDSPDSPSK